MVSDQKPVRNKLDAKQQNLYFQTIQIQWNSYLKLLRKQIMEAAQQSKKTIIFDSEMIGKFLVDKDKLAYVNNGVMQVSCGKNTSAEVNIVSD